MTVEEIFIEIISHMKKGISFHNDLATIYSFLNLCGYSKCHEYHYYEENFNCHCLKKFYLDNYEKMIPIKSIEKIEIIPVNWYKYKKSDVDANTKRATIKDMTKKWINWEEETKQLLQNSYKQLYELGEINAAMKIKHLLHDVNEELLVAKSKYLDLEALGYDVSVIIPEQKILYKKYVDKIQDIYKDDEDD